MLLRADLIIIRYVTKVVTAFLQIVCDKSARGVIVTGARAARRDKKKAVTAMPSQVFPESPAIRPAAGARYLIAADRR